MKLKSIKTELLQVFRFHQISCLAEEKTNEELAKEREYSTLNVV